MVPDEVSLHCPHCGKHTAVSPAPLVVIVPSPGTPPNEIAERSVKDWLNQTPYYRYGSGAWWLGKCNACQQPIVVRDRGAKVFPTPQPGPVNDAIPEPMRSDLREAKQCLAANANNATVVMARRALQTAAVNLGAPKGQQLWQQIKHLADSHLITGPQKTWADAARWVGNHGAHDTEPDVKNGVVAITEVTDDDAKATVDLVEHLFESLYVAPKLAEEQLKKRNKS